MINPAAKSAVKITQNNKIGVIGTNYTINNLAYHKAINDVDPKIKIIGKACPQLVFLAEKGKLIGDRPKKVVKECILEIKKEKIDTLVLGCTHFPLFLDYIKEYIDFKIKLIDPAVEAVKLIKNNFALNTYSYRENSEFVYSFYTSGETNKFEKISSIILNKKIKAQKIVLDN